MLLWWIEPADLSDASSLVFICLSLTIIYYLASISAEPTASSLIGSSIINLWWRRKCWLSLGAWAASTRGTIWCVADKYFTFIGFPWTELFSSVGSNYYETASPPLNSRRLWLTTRFSPSSQRCCIASLMVMSTCMCMHGLMNLLACMLGFEKYGPMAAHASVSNHLCTRPLPTPPMTRWADNFLTRLRVCTWSVPPKTNRGTMSSL